MFIPLFVRTRGSHIIHLWGKRIYISTHAHTIWEYIFEVGLDGWHLSGVSRQPMGEEVFVFQKFVPVQK